ncbi:MAG: phage major capsid protein [Pseudomonadota bacterium]|nr:phage major capsid protein [Pseudomonadota bacterium]
MADGDSKDLPQLAEAMKKAIDDVKALGQDITGKMTAGEIVTQSVKEQADEALLKMNGLQTQITDMEQKLARRGEPDEDDQPKTLGEQFVGTEQFKKFAEMPMPRGRVDMQQKATITLATTGTGAAGSTVQTARVPGLVAPPERRMTVRDLITPGRMDGNALEYVKETGFVNNAGNVGEALAKPQSDLTFSLVSTTAKVIAHYVKASRQILSDSSMLASYIDGRLRYGLAFREESQILNGDGTGQNLLGIIPQASAYVLPTGLTAPAGSTKELDQLRFAMLQAVLAEYPATGTVLHPTDWARIETVKDTQGRYIIGQPQGTIQPTLWGLPVVATQAIAVDKFLVGAFKLGAQLFDRWLARVEVATENENDFIMNLVTILAEERVALAVYRPEAFVYGDMGNVV